jgi:hypothetical protein
MITRFLRQFVALLIPRCGFVQFLPAIISAASAIGSGLAGKQKAPKQVDPINVQDEQKKAIAGNLDASGDIESLLSRANSFSQDQATGLMEKSVPGWSKLSQKMMGLAGDAADDPFGVPKDVQDNITRLAAERGVSTGVKGQAGEFSLLRDFGVNSLEYGNARIGQAQSILQTIVGLSPRVNPASPLSFYVTPGQQIDAATGNNDVKQQGYNAQAKARNDNATMWAEIIGNVGGTVSGAIKPKT